MSIGVVKKMNNGWASTPNNGILIDLATNIEYPFARPDTDGSVKPDKWNVKKHDLVSFTLVDGIPTDVTLYRTHTKGFVYNV